MAQLLLWPWCVLPAADPAFDLAPRSLRGSANGAGHSQVVVSPAGIWTARFGRVPLNTPQRIKCWRALEALIQGRATPLLVPMRDKPDRMPLPATANGRRSVTVAHAGGILFSDGTGYQQATTAAELAAPAALAATTVSIRMLLGAAPEPGQHFSIGVRLYRIAQITAQSGNVSTVRVWPPLREAAAAGAACDFSNPVCKMRLASDTELAAQSLSANRFATADVSFIEDTL